MVCDKCGLRHRYGKCAARKLATQNALIAATSKPTQLIYTRGVPPKGIAKSSEMLLECPVPPKVVMVDWDRLAECALTPMYQMALDTICHIGARRETTTVLVLRRWEVTMPASPLLAFYLARAIRRAAPDARPGEISAAAADAFMARIIGVLPTNRMNLSWVKMFFKASCTADFWDLCQRKFAGTEAKRMKDFIQVSIQQTKQALSSATRASERRQVQLQVQLQYLQSLVDYSRPSMWDKSQEIQEGLTEQSVKAELFQIECGNYKKRC